MEEERCSQCLKFNKLKVLFEMMYMNLVFLFQYFGHHLSIFISEFEICHNGFPYRPNHRYCQYLQNLHIYDYFDSIKI